MCGQLPPLKLYSKEKSDYLQITTGWFEALHCAHHLKIHTVRAIFTKICIQSVSNTLTSSKNWIGIEYVLLGIHVHYSRAEQIPQRASKAEQT